MSNKGNVAVVTGASRGAGRGIAHALGSHGFTVYVTGRTESADTSSLSGTIHDTAAMVNSAGGTGIAVRVDHGDDEQVKALFEQVRREQGRLDILVNNACAINDAVLAPGNFWEKPLAVVDMLEVGLRSSYVASYHAAPLMLEQGSGLIVFTSSSGSVHYCLGPAYGAHKAGLDKLAADMAVDFSAHGITTLSIWMGALKTERVTQLIASDPEKFRALEETLETPEFTGHVIAALFNDAELAAFSGQTLIGAETALHYGIQDAGGRQPPSCRDTHGSPRQQSAMIIR